MTTIKANNNELKKLVNDIPLFTPDKQVSKKHSTKKRIRRIAEPHIRAHQVKGRQYYSYIRGEDKEIYLGTAESILKAVRNQNRKGARL